MTKDSRFISIEGGEGVGKSYLSQGLKLRLEALKYEVLLTHEPGGTPLASAIRQLFLNPPEKPAALTELYLVSAARAQHVQKLIRPQLEAGRWVLCDRFYDSTRIYQGDLGGVPEAVLEATIEASVDGCHPAQTFVLDCPADVAMSRVEKRAKELQWDGGNRYDEGSRAMHETLRQGYLKRARQFPDRIHVLDASRPPQEVLEAAWSHLKQHFSL